MPRVTADRSEGVLDLLKRLLPDWKTSTLKQRLKNGLVLRNGKPVMSGAERVEAGEVLQLLAVPPRPASFFPAGLGEPPLDILYADDSLVAVDKPSGLLSVATEREKNMTAIRIMRDWLIGLERDDHRELHAAHRLDREASGVLLFTRTLELKRKLAAGWGEFEKIYLAVVDGEPPASEGSIDAPLWEDRGLFVRVSDSGAGEKALTHYRVLKKTRDRALLEVRLGTGRKHQIRVHLAHIGCPIVGDPRYGVSKSPRLALHAHILRLRHPTDGRELVITAPIPVQFKKMMSGR